MKRFWLSVLILGFALMQSACGDATISAPAPLTLTLSTVDAALPLVTHLGDAFNTEHPHITLAVSSVNATRAWMRLATGEVDAAIVSMLPAEASDFQQTPIARDGAVIIVHPDNPLENLTLLELQRLFSGLIDNWRDVQSSAMTVQPVVRESDSGLRAIFETRVMPDSRITPNARVLPNGPAVVDFVAQNPNAIGYVSATMVDARVKVLSVEDLFPTPENLTLGAYPLTYELFLLTPRDAKSEIKDFAAQFTSAAGQDFAVEMGFGKIK